MANRYRWSDIFSIIFIIVGVAVLAFLILRGVFTGLENDKDEMKYDADTTTLSTVETISSSLTTTTIPGDGLCSLSNNCVMNCNGSTDVRLGIEIGSALIESGCKNLILIIVNNNFTQRVLKNNWLKALGDMQVLELEIINCNFEAIEGGAFASAHFKDLSKLTIKNLQVTYLENQHFRGLDNLNYLSIENCKTSLSVEAGLLGGLPSLTTLQIHSCLYGPTAVVNTTGESSGGFNNLQIIDFTRNMLEALPSHSFSKTPKLEILILAHNNLSYLPKDIFWSNDLKQLSLEGNKLETIEDGIFRSVIGTSIMLGGNPWTCNCDLKWLKDFLQKVPTPERFNAKCQNNDTSVAEYDFKCPEKILEGTDLVPCNSLPMDKEEFTFDCFEINFDRINSSTFRVAIIAKRQNNNTLMVFQTPNRTKLLYNSNSNESHFFVNVDLKYMACIGSIPLSMEYKPEERTSYILTVANVLIILFILLGTLSLACMIILCYLEVQKYMRRNVVVINKKKKTENILENLSKRTRGNPILTAPRSHIIKYNESSIAIGSGKQVAYIK